MKTPNRVHGRTARQWLIEFAAGELRRDPTLGAHLALERVADQARGYRDGTLMKYAAGAYAGEGWVWLERLIAAVEREAGLRPAAK